ncbi:FAD-binding oxidoreductase [Kutzneria sp. NPDC051319]|uniref:NAD(P)/FAD-dependent oxidoreductase n=1 Tax=Kutzneria sp. NPDC051319 TaxID=3155047 RepID=UPI00343E9FE9
MNATPWSETGDPGSRPRLRGHQRCDVAVVGAGLTGLTAAAELARLAPELRIVVVEADHCAAGASGRGTGLLGPRVGPPLAVARRRFGDDVARSAYLWSVEAVRAVLALVEEHRIECDLIPGGQLVVAPDEAAAQAQQREADAARALGLPISLVSQGELPAFAQGYLGALRYEPAATLDPAALTGQLARIAEQRGVTIHERSPVREIRRGLVTIVRTDDAELSADRVVVALNAYGGIPGTPAGVFGVRVQAGVTGKLPPAALAAVESLRTDTLIEHGELSPYFRLTSDDRIVVGGGVVRRGAYGSLAPSPGRLRAAARALAPELSDVDIESAWAGPVGMTRDGLPLLGNDSRDPGIFNVGGCNGHGLAVSVANGAHVARWIATGRKDHLSFALPWLRPKAPWLPRGGLAGRALDGYLAWLSAGQSDRPRERLS